MINRAWEGLRCAQHWPRRNNSRVPHSWVDGSPHANIQRSRYDCKRIENCIKRILTLSSGGMLRSKYRSRNGTFDRISCLTRGTSPKKKTAKTPAATPNVPAMAPLLRPKFSIGETFHDSHAPRVQTYYLVALPKVRPWKWVETVYLRKVKSRN